jgi:TonB family protein
MVRYEGRKVAILVTVIIHLVAGIIFMIVRIGGLNIKEYRRDYELAIQTQPEPAPAQEQSQSRVYSVEQVVRGDQELLNIARNLANQPDVKINRDDYIDRVKEELIESGKLGKDNYIDEQKKVKENGVEITEKPDEKKAKDQMDKKADNSNEMASKYSGPTRIYYNLPGRTHSYLPLPIYKCEGAGKVVLSIEVNPNGDVTNASVITSESTTSDPCLLETALNTALISRFNPDVKAVKNESGTLTYHFVAQ